MNAGEKSPYASSNRRRGKGSILNAPLFFFQAEEQDCPDGPVRLCTPKAGGPGSIPDQETRSHMLQLKILCTATQTWHSQKLN